MTKPETISLFLGKISVKFALFSENFTQLTRILHDRRSHWSRQISTLVNSYLKNANFCEDFTRGGSKNIELTGGKNTAGISVWFPQRETQYLWGHKWSWWGVKKLMIFLISPSTNGNPSSDNIIKPIFKQTRQLQIWMIAIMCTFWFGWLILNYFWLEWTVGFSPALLTIAILTSLLPLQSWNSVMEVLWNFLLSWNKSAFMEELWTYSRNFAFMEELDQEFSFHGRFVKLY